jgi:F-type H+-transporting ATPase subunit delta
LIPEISNQFIVLYKKYKNILPANLLTSVEVDNETRQHLINLLHKHTKSEIELTEEVKKELVGGFILSFEDQQYDASIQRKIKNLKKEFEINLYVKGF